MANPIKYSTGSESLSLKKGNFYIGTGDVGKGPTSTTGYYNGITPPSGGYTIYLNKATGGPSIYTCSNDTELISLTNSIAGTSYTTANECLVYFAGQTDKVCFNRDYEGIVTDGLIFSMDAGFTPSYPKNGTTNYNLSNTFNGTLTNGVSFNSSNGGSFVFDGTDDYINYGNNLDITGSFSINIWFKSASSQSSSFCGLVSKDASGNFGNYGIYGDNPSNYIRFGFYGTDNAQREVSNSSYYDLVSQTWVNYLGTYDQSNLKLYRNGSLIAQSSVSTTPKTNTTSLTIGTRLANNLEYKGDIAIVQIYNKGLLSTEVLQNYNAQKDRFGL